MLIGGKPAAVMGSSGMNTGAPHVGIVDPPFAGGPPAQMGRILSGSPTVMIGGRPALRVGDMAGCGAPIIMGAPTVNVG